LIGPRWDLLGWNDLADRLFSWSKLSDKHPNIIRTIFTSAHFRRLWVNWEREAQELLAQFRLDYNQNIHDKSAYESLVAELSQSSPEFREWWPHHDVMQRIGWVRELNHPRVGALKLESIVLETPGHPYPRLIVYSGSEAQDCQKLQLLKQEKI
jgi:hypothetical protein